MALKSPAFNDARSGTYRFGWLRWMLEAALAEGVLDSGDLAVTLGTGGMRLSLAAGAGVVKGDSGVPVLGFTQGLYGVVNDQTEPDLYTLAAGDATNPRIDRVGVLVRDSTDLGTGADDTIPVILTGTPAAGATLSNMTGAAAVTNDVLLLADALVAPGATTGAGITLRDRRTYARGKTFDVAATGDTAALGGAFQTIPGAAIAFDLARGQSVLCAGAAYVNSAIAGGSIFAHWRLTDAGGHTFYETREAPVQGAEVGAGLNALIPCTAVFSPRLNPTLTPGLITVALEVWSSGGNGGKGLNTYSGGRIEVRNSV